jgi:hypothetical protein
LLSLLCVVVAGLLACGAESEAPEQPAEKPAVADPTALEPAVAPPRAFQRAVLPDQFPKDLPQYPGATLGDARSEPGGGMFADYKTPDSLEKVRAFFHSSLESEGWRIETERKLMIFASKESRTFTLLLSDEGDHTWFDITLLPID